MPGDPKIVRATEQANLSLVLDDWMKEERETQEPHQEESTKCPIDAVKAARAGTQ